MLYDSTALHIYNDIQPCIYDSIFTVIDFPPGGIDQKSAQSILPFGILSSEQIVFKQVDHAEDAVQSRRLVDLEFGLHADSI